MDALLATHVPERISAVNVSAGARIGVENLDGTVCHKFAVIEVEDDHPAVFVGSYNWTKADACSNDEDTWLPPDLSVQALSG